MPVSLCEVMAAPPLGTGDHPPPVMLAGESGRRHLQRPPVPPPPGREGHTRKASGTFVRIDRSKAPFVQPGGAFPRHSLETFPDQTHMIVDSGHEVGAHGYSHENHSMTEAHGVLDGRTALVVGAGSGIGRAIAQAFAAVGANVVAADRKNAQLFIDVTDEESVRTAVAEASAGSGRIDVPVNSAGILTESPLVEMDLTTTWTETIAVTSRESSCAAGMWCPARRSAGSGGSSTSRPSS